MALYTEFLITILAYTFLVKDIESAPQLTDVSGVVGNLQNQTISMPSMGSVGGNGGNSSGNGGGFGGGNGGGFGGGNGGGIGGGNGGGIGGGNGGGIGSGNGGGIGSGNGGGIGGGSGGYRPFEDAQNQTVNFPGMSYPGSYYEQAQNQTINLPSAPSMGDISNTTLPTGGVYVDRFQEQTGNLNNQTSQYQQCMPGQTTTNNRKNKHRN